MPTIYIDKQPYQVRDGQNLLQACLELGFDLPFFCWHPAMGSVGACRQCAIKQFRDKDDTKGRIVMACMTPAADNTYISLTDPEAIEFRRSVIEWLMMNHPHDCPVCDEGGECHLQDMTQMTGHNYRHYEGQKRTFYNQDLGPFVMHQMNRCIQCYRCVRYYRGVAGGKDLDAFSIHDTVYFGRAADGALESEFSGNLVEVCPTGVFTDKTLNKHYVRKWDLQSAPSICVNCSVGCNTIPGERHKRLRRVHSRYNGDVNGYFLCDRGRYGYEFVNSEQRIRQPRFSGLQEALDRQSAAARAAEILSSSRRVIGIGSPRASLESNYALRALVGAENFYQGVPETERAVAAEIIQILQNGPARTPSLQEIAACDAVLVLGEDVSNTAPMIALELRQSVRVQPKRQAAKLRIADWDDYSNRLVIQDQKGPLFIATPAATRMDDIATSIYHGAPDDIARLGFAIAHELDEAAPQVEHLSDPLREMARMIAGVLKAAEKPLIVSGASLGSLAVVQAAASAAWALIAAGKPAALSYALPENNSLGLALMGGDSLGSLSQDLSSGQPAEPSTAMIVLENDLSRRMGTEASEALLRSAEQVIALDALENATTHLAGAVLPAGTFAESSGSFVNQEGRVQRFYQVFEPDGSVQESWGWIRDILSAMGRDTWQNLDALQAALVEELPVFRPLLEVAPPASFRIAGAKIPRQPMRWSGRTANHAHETVHEPAPPPDPDSPLNFTMEGAGLQPPPALIPRFWAPGWNSIQSIIRYQSQVPGPLKGGNPGKRLIEPGPGPTPAYFREVPAAFTRREVQWLVVPLYHVFGSEELSMHTEGVAELAPQPYLAVNPEDAAAIQGVVLPVLENGALDITGLRETTATLSLNQSEIRLPARLDTALPRGMVGVPVGLVSLPDLQAIFPGRGQAAFGQLTLENTAGDGKAGSL